jgi:hypothetical protein
VVRLTVSVPVVHAVHRLAVYLQTALWSLEQVVERSILVLVKASAAGIAAVLGFAPVHDNSLLAAVIVTVMKTVCYITIQFCHDKFPPVILKYILQGYHAQDSADYFTKKFLLEINL